MAVSSARITSECFALLLLAGMAVAGQRSAPAPATSVDPIRSFQQGQEALAQGRLEEAERDFRRVLEVDPKAGGAYANLGVVYMRRKQWALALTHLKKASRMMPQVAGIRLN